MTKIFRCLCNRVQYSCDVFDLWFEHFWEEKYFLVPAGTNQKREISADTFKNPRAVEPMQLQSIGFRSVFDSTLYRWHIGRHLDVTNQAFLYPRTPIRQISSNSSLFSCADNFSADKFRVTPETGKNTDTAQQIADIHLYGFWAMLFLISYLFETLFTVWISAWTAGLLSLVFFSTCLSLALAKDSRCRIVPRNVGAVHVCFLTARPYQSTLPVRKGRKT